MQRAKASVGRFLLLSFLLVLPQDGLVAESDLEKTARILNAISQEFSKKTNSPQSSQNQSSSAYSHVPVNRNNRFIDWNSFVCINQNAFPCMIFGLSNVKDPRVLSFINNPNGLTGIFGDQSAIVGVALRPRVFIPRITVKVSALPFLQESEIDIGNLQPGGTYLAKPTLVWDYKEIRNLNQAIPCTLTTSLVAPDGMILDKDNSRFFMRSPNDCPITGGPVLSPYDYLLASFVNEDAPVIDKLLKSALSTAVTENFAGYQEGSKNAFFKQLFAIWQALQKNGMHYSSITEVSIKSNDVPTQHIRFMNESMLNQQANCIDGTVLLASVCKKISLRPSIVLLNPTTPGAKTANHAILAVSGMEDGRHVIYIDTTVMRSYEGTFDSSWKNFQQALMQGELAVKQSKANGFPPKLIDIEEARRIGFAPIPLFSK